jgi:FkbM family methyltransferase
MDIRDLDGNIVDIEYLEKCEQILAEEFILENDVVLELGARYGSVSCIINSKLKNKYNQVVVEPDDRVWDALEKNRSRNDCYFNIVKGFISEKKMDLTNLDVYYGGYGATFIYNNETRIPSYSLNEITQKYNLNFNVLVADCEGFLEVFFDENPDFYDKLRLIIFEEDYPDKCNYNKIRNNLEEKGFTEIIYGHQNVWLRGPQYMSQFCNLEQQLSRSNERQTQTQTNEHTCYIL